MKRILFLLIFLIFCGNYAFSADKPVEPYDLTVEYMSEPVGIDSPKPRLSWKSKTNDAILKNVTQTAYQILVASSEEMLDKNQANLWDSGKIKSNQSLNIEYAGKPLTSSLRCFWKVHVWYAVDNEPLCDAVSANSCWITGIMNPNDWKAKWIGSQVEPFNNNMPEELQTPKWIWAGDTESLNQAEAGRRYFRKEFNLQDPATDEGWQKNKNAFTPPEIPRDFLTGGIGITADDKYELYVNGHKIAEPWGHVFDWKLIRVFQIAQYVKPGKNVIGVCVINDKPGPTGLIALAFVYDSIGTDSSWKWSTEPTDGWNSNVENFDDSAWKNAVEVGNIGCQPWGELRNDYIWRLDGRSNAFIKSFRIHETKKVQSATLHITGLGFYEAFLNGTRIGNRVLDPIPTRYDKRVLYSTYDLTDEIKTSNLLRVDLGHGWYDVRTVSVWNFDLAPWRDSPRLLAQLEIVFDDGTSETIVSDETWKCDFSKTMYDCIRQGEQQLFQDAQNENLKTEDDYTDKENAIIVSAPKGRLSAENMPASVITEELKPAKITEPKPGVYVADFGQNIAGWIRLRIKNQETDDFVRIKYAERLAEDGRINQKPNDQFFKQGSLRMPMIEEGHFQTDVFTPHTKESIGEGKYMTFEPRFVYHGFQYVEITGLSEPLVAANITGCVVHTDFKSAGKFECSNELFNKIQNATLWSYRGNYVNGFPTDCPHREKNGWTGDALLAAEQAQYNWENTTGYEKWIHDLIDEQQPDGNLPGIVPTSGWGYEWGNGPAWDSAIIQIPWYLYTYKGDKRILEESYDAMKKYVDYLSSREKPNGLVDHGLGDWCFAKTETPVVITSSVYYFLDVQTMMNVAKILEKEADAKKYADLAMRISKAYVKELVHEDGTIGNGSITSQSFPLYYGVISESLLRDGEAGVELYKKTGAKLFEAIEKADYHNDVGILGAKVLFHELTKQGKTDVALRILNQKTEPSYGSWFERGATTLWEDWGDGSSRNHVMFGDVSAWFYKTLAGINGYYGRGLKDITICPGAVFDEKFPQNIDWVKAEHDSPYGLIKVDWNRTDKKITLKFSIPVNTTASVVSKLYEKGRDYTTYGSGDYVIELEEP